MLDHLILSNGYCNMQNGGAPPLERVMDGAFGEMKFMLGTDG